MNWNELWHNKYAPKTMGDIILSPEVKDFILSKDISSIPHLLLYGGPGTGKTTLAKRIVDDLLKCQYLFINGSAQNSIDVVRNDIVSFAQTKSIDGKMKVIIIDEADGISGISSASRSSAQQALRNVIDENHNYVRFILTCNYPNKIIEAIHSRCIAINITLTYEDCLRRIVSVLKAEKIVIPNKGELVKLKEFVKKSAPDLRKIFNATQKFCSSGILNVVLEYDVESISKTIIEDLIAKRNLFDLRKEIIENEAKFNTDYHDLLKGMYSLITSEYGLEKFPFEKRLELTLLLANGMYQHDIVVDKEVNFTSSMFQMSKVLVK